MIFLVNQNNLRFNKTTFSSKHHHNPNKTSNLINFINPNPSLIFNLNKPSNHKQQVHSQIIINPIMISFLKQMEILMMMNGMISQEHNKLISSNLNNKLFNLFNQYKLFNQFNQCNQNLHKINHLKNMMKKIHGATLV